MNYDPFQLQAISYINQGHSVIVSAPTGAGKTAIAEHVILESLKKNERVIYTAPIKALSNQKFRDFQAEYSDRIGILTGDVSINPHAPILIMTTEIFRNKLLTEAADLSEYSWIIFDEIHYLDNYERGTVWEESLIFLPEHMNILALSATIPNITEFAEWIQRIHGKILKTVIEHKRPVPLHFSFQCQGKVFDRLKNMHHACYKDVHYRGRFEKKTDSKKINRLGSLVQHLLDSDRLPCIYFAFSRRRCEVLAGELFHFNFLSKKEETAIRKLFDDLCLRFDLVHEKSTELIRPLILRGIAYHHAGMLPTLKEVVERLFTSRLIKAIFTTETFALGINMPARTVIFDELRKFYGKSFANLKTRDFYQMAGRAGRRGIDTEGFVYSRIIPNRISYKELKRILLGEPEKVLSRFNASYATILNLYATYGEELYTIYPRSFHYFQVKEKFRKKAVERMRAKVSILKELGYIGRNAITEKGQFACNMYGYELPLTELYEQGLLEQLSVTDLGILAVAAVYEPRKGVNKPVLGKRGKYIRQLTDGVMTYIHKKETKHKIKELSKDYFFHLTLCIEAWMRQEDFNAIMHYTEADEGEIIRNFRMAVQILREMLETPAPKPFKEKVKRTMYLIGRGVVDAEKQLREG